MINPSLQSMVSYLLSVTPETHTHTPRSALFNIPKCQGRSPGFYCLKTQRDASVCTRSISQSVFQHEMMKFNSCSRSKFLQSCFVTLVKIAVQIKSRKTDLPDSRPNRTCCDSCHCSSSVLLLFFKVRTFKVKCFIVYLSSRMFFLHLLSVLFSLVSVLSGRFEHPSGRRVKFLYYYIMNSDAVTF